MSETNRKTKVAIRQEIRYPQLSELSMIYEGATEDIAVRPPDLSSHGMFINTPNEFPEGAVLKLRFRLSRTGVLVQTRCEVRYCLKGVGIGVEFVDASPEAMHAIEEEISVQLAGK
jgi:PilZ domain-containing protein